MKTKTSICVKTDRMDASEHDVLAYMAIPRQHRTKLHSKDVIERLNKKVKRRAHIVGIFPNEASILRLDRQGRGRPAFQYHDKSRLIMPSDHLAIYPTLMHVLGGSPCKRL